MAAGAGGDSALLSGSLINSQSNGMGGLLKTGLGTLILSGMNSYDGGTTVAAGGLVLASNTALPEGTSLTVGAGATLIFDPLQAGSPIFASAVVATVPEPGTLPLLLAALVVGFGVWSRRKWWAVGPNVN